MADNPLLSDYELPPFDRIRPEHVEPAIDGLLADNRAAVQALLDAGGPWTWERLAEPLEELDERLGRAWSPAAHLNSVVNSESLRAAYNACLPKLAEYAADLGQNERLFMAWKALAEGPGVGAFDAAQRKTVEHALRDFCLSGVALDRDERERFKAIQQELATWAAKYEENLLDATHAWHKDLPDAEADALAGVPPTALTLFRQQAEAAGVSGYRITLDYPSYHPVMSYAHDSVLRKELYEAYVTRASDQGPLAGRHDNGPAMASILALRHEAARLLGYAHFAEYSLTTKMAESPQQVLEFLYELAAKARPMALRELAELTDFAREHGTGELQAWDIAYWSERLRQARYALSAEDLRAYFPTPKVLSGLFAVVRRLYGIEIRPREGVAVWHPDVQFFELYDAEGHRRGGFYLDLYARAHKRGGAWMDECLTRRHRHGRVQNPIAYLTCNFTPPADATPALLTHDEVETLFHEFGHGLHHLLTRVDQPQVAGIHGVPWDAVELPSQFMENWCWQREALDLFSGHYQTGEPLPQQWLDRMLAAKHFQAGMQMVRQLEFSLFDFRLHAEYEPARGARIDALLEEIRREIAVIRPPAFNRFAHSFAHIFAGGYGAGYYSYKWAEVLSADAFSLFEERGVFDPATGQRFLRTVLEQGGSREPMELFVEFRGREPRIEALLRQHGLLAA